MDEERGRFLCSCFPLLCELAAEARNRAIFEAELLCSCLTIAPATLRSERGRFLRSWMLGFLAVLPVSVLVPLSGVVSGIEAQDLLEALPGSRDIMSDQKNAASQPNDPAKETANLSSGEKAAGKPEHPSETQPHGK